MSRVGGVSRRGAEGDTGGRRLRAPVLLSGVSDDIGVQRQIFGTALESRSTLRTLGSFLNWIWVWFKLNVSGMSHSTRRPYYTLHFSSQSSEPERQLRLVLGIAPCSQLSIFAFSDHILGHQWQLLSVGAGVAGGVSPFLEAFGFYVISEDWQISLPAENGFWSLRFNPRICLLLTLWSWTVIYCLEPQFPHL